MSESTAASLLDQLIRFVPAHVVRHFAADPQPLTSPRVSRYPAAVLFTDISGFTALTEQLAQGSPNGAETLSHILNSYFDPLIQQIHLHGGDVVKFAGDALLSIWMGDDLAALTNHAAQCALALQQILQTQQAVAGVQLAARISIGVGDLFLLHLGGVYGRWEFLPTGTVLTQIKHGIRHTQPGEIALSPEAQTFIKGLGQPLTDGYLRLEAIAEVLPPEPLVMPALPPAAEASLRGYIPGAILARLAAQQINWLAEMRRVTVIFMNLPDLSYNTPLARAQKIASSLQTALYRYEGSINKLSVDDKGVTLVAALGLPPLAHEDDSVRGIKAALDMQAALNEMGVQSAIGIATGRAFCGTVGSQTRCEYTMMGDVVNLAARLMQAAGEGMLCDSVTYRAAQARIDFAVLAPIMVKGKTEPVPVFRPLVESKTTGKQAAGMVGRQAERGWLSQQFQALQNGQSGIVTIEGEAGIGKSRLLEDLIMQAHQIGQSPLIGWSEAIEKSTAYYAWRNVFKQLFAITDLEVVDLQTFIAQIPPALRRFAPLLNAVLPLDIPETDFTRQMTSEIRAENTQVLLINLLQQAAEQAPLLLLMEDAHWFDSASWGLVTAVGRFVTPCLLVITTRPLVEPLPSDYATLSQLPSYQRLSLHMLPAEDIRGLICQKLGVSNLPEPVAALIREKAEGHPFFSEELAYALHDADIIRITEGRCELIGDLNNIQFPDTLQGVITSRIDRLTPSQQLALKAASVIGRIFAFRVLRDIYPIEADKPALLAHLEAVRKLDITPLESPEPDLAYIFKHAITQEVTYNLMVQTHRKELHQAVALWYEQHYEDELAPYYPLLAYHWEHAEDIDRTLDYLEKAGEQALRHGAYQEAILFINKVLALTKSDDPVQHSSWHQRLGEAYYYLGNHPKEVEHHLTRALTLLGYHFPTTRSGKAFHLTRQVIRQCLHRLLPSYFIGRTPEKQKQTRIFAEANLILVATYYIDNRVMDTVYVWTYSLNEVEACNVDERAETYIGTSMMASMAHASRIAEAYARLARDMLTSKPALAERSAVHHMFGLYYMAHGRWQEAEAVCEKSVQISEKTGNYRRCDEAAIIQGTSLFLESRFSESLSLFKITHQRSLMRQDHEFVVVSLASQMFNLLALDHLEEALHLIQQFPGSTENLPTSIIHLMFSARGKVFFRANDHAYAYQSACLALETVANSPVSVVSALEAYSMVAEVLLRLWEQNHPAPSLPLLAKQACRSMDSYTRTYAIGKPRSGLHWGTYYRLSGKPRKAQEAWQKALDQVQQFAMPYDEGMIHHEIGRHLAADDPQWQIHLDQARTIFQRIGAAYDLQQIEKISPR